MSKKQGFSLISKLSYVLLMHYLQNTENTHGYLLLYMTNPVPMVRVWVFHGYLWNYLQVTHAT